MLVVPLFDKGDLFGLRVTLKRDVFDQADSSIYELLFREEALEDQLSVSDVKSVQVLRLDLLLRSDCHAVQLPELRDVKEHL